METKTELTPEDKLIALNILLVIYLQERRYQNALEDIEELLNDPEMDFYHELLIQKQNEVRELFLL